MLPLTAAVSGLLAGLALSAALPPSFRASVRVRAEWDRPGDGVAVRRLSNEASRRLQQVRQRLTSPAAIARALRDVRSDPSGSQAAAASPAETEAVRDAVDVRPGDDGTYLVGYAHRDAVRSALVANRLTDALVEEVASEAAGSKPDAEALRVRLLEARRTLEEKEVALLGLRQRETGAVSGGKAATVPSPGPLEKETRKVSVELAAARARAELLRQTIETAPAAATVEPSGPAAELARLRTNREDLRRRYTDAHPDVEAIDRRIRQLEANLPPAAAPAPAPPVEPSALAEVEASIRALEEREALLEAEAAKVNGRRQPAGRPADDRRGLLLDVQRAQESYQALVAEWRASETASLVRGSGLILFQVLEAARTPDRPTFPDRRLLAVTGLSLGLALGLVAALVAELRDRTVKGPEDVQALLSAPLLATLPLVRASRFRSSAPPRPRGPADGGSIHGG